MTWIDVHTHLNMLEGGPEAALERAKKAGVEQLITIGTEPKDHPLVLELAERFYPQVLCSLGIHPHEAELFTAEVAEFIDRHAERKEVAAIGEIGLDFYYDNAPREKQQEVFRAQLELAAKWKLPVEIHTRDAEAETVRILEDFRGQVRGIIHCFTGTRWLAEKCLALGFNISFSGIITFKNAEDLREVVRSVPLDRLHVETDAPFLTPVPHRGKKNEPAMMVHTAELIASLKGISLVELADQTRANAHRMFPKLVVAG